MLQKIYRTKTVSKSIDRRRILESSPYVPDDDIVPTGYASGEATSNGIILTMWGKGPQV